MRPRTFDSNNYRIPQIYNKKGESVHLWWEAGKDDLHKLVFGTARYLADRHRQRLAANLHHLRVYSNRLAASLSGSAFTAGVENGERIKLNATKSAVDAATAQVATNQPSVMHLTIGGDWDQRKRAERLDKYVKGWFHELQLYVAWLGVFLDACVDGVGHMKFLATPNGRIACERVRSDEIFVDENESRVIMPGVGPRWLFQMRPVPRSWLETHPAFRKHRDLVDEAEYIEDAHPAYPQVDDPITLVEAWRRPEFGKPGRHCICLSNGTLLDEQWHCDPPFATFRWCEAPVGFYGIGAVEEALPVQLELNWLAQKLQRLLHFATSVIFREKNSAMGKITNEDFAIYDYTGQMPQFINVQAASSEYYNHIDRLYTRIYELLGVSMMEATGVKPAGLYSGDAIRLYHDVATRRFRHIEQRAGQFFLDCASQIEDRAREIVKRGWGTARTLAMGDAEVEQLDWSDVRMEKDQFVMRLRPVSIVPDEPAGKVDLIKTLAPIAPAAAPYLVGKLSGIPDLEAMVDRVNAPQDYAERLVSNIIEKGQFEIPMMEADLAAIRDTAQREAMMAEERGINPDRKALLQRLVLVVDGMQLQQQQQMMMTMPGSPAGGPAAGGMAPPGMPPVPPQALAAGIGAGGGSTTLPPGGALPGLGPTLQ